MGEPATSLRVLNEEIVACRKCARLVKYREEVARVKRRMFREWEYWGKAVPGFGDPRAQLQEHLDEEARREQGGGQGGAREESGEERQGRAVGRHRQRPGADDRRRCCKYAGGLWTAVAQPKMLIVRGGTIRVETTNARRLGY